MVAPRALAGHGRVGLDTSLFIYTYEQTSPFTAAAMAVLRAVEQGHISGVISTLVLAELLVLPYRLRRHDLVSVYLRQLRSFPHLTVVAPDVEICQAGARLRAATPSLMLVDAIHLATALCASATAFVTNDARIHSVEELAVLQLRTLRQS